MSRPKKSEKQLLEDYRIAFQNVSDQPAAAAAMEEVGYGQPEIQQGKDLWTTTNNLMNKTTTETDESAEAYTVFSVKFDVLTSQYKSHRKKTKVAFRNNAIMLERLHIDGSMPDAYLPFLEQVKIFYSIANADPSVASTTSRLKRTAQQLADTALLIPDVERLRAAYIKEKGESQQATKDKDAALATLDNWMKEFYAVAKIALEDQPQLLESIAKFVRS
jgi:hypothetical protein